jgi:hypothetical protein
MDISSLLVADVQSAKLIEPSKRPLHDPPPSAQSTAMLGVTLCQQKGTICRSRRPWRIACAS